MTIETDKTESLADRLLKTSQAVALHRAYGRVAGVQGLLVEISGLEGQISIGGRCDIRASEGVSVPCEIVGFRQGHALAMPFATLEGVGLGCQAMVATSRPALYPTRKWLGRVINAMGEPVDGKGVLLPGGQAMLLRSSPPSAHQRQRIGAPLDLGVRAINSFLTCCEGQRMGIFSGSGVGKSTVLSMMAQHTAADVTIIGLVGERGREVQEFIEDDLGAEGLQRSIVVVATGDESPLMRRQAAYSTLALAEYFRAQGQKVLCLIDSVTRFAMAQREIGLSAGEPPTAKGYPPTTFSELARLLERAGPGPQGEGSITGLFTVLVEGDDHNEPISDAVRGILDGHIVLDRAIAERNRYPAVNILRSVSRSMPACHSEEQNALIAAARAHISTYEDMAELIRLGAYKQGTDARVDAAIKVYPLIEDFLRQSKEELANPQAGFARLAEILAIVPDERGGG